MTHEEDHIALVDLDGTVADCDGALKEAMEILRSPNEPSYADRYTDGTEPAYIEARRKMVQRQPGFWRNLKKLPLGFEVVDELRKAGFQLHVLSKGPRKNGAAWGEKLEWSIEHLPDATVTVTGNKSISYGRVLFDDFPPYFLAWLKVHPRGLVICLAHPWNEKFKKGGTEANPNVVRYDGSDVIELREAIIRGSASTSSSAASGWAIPSCRSRRVKRTTRSLMRAITKRCSISSQNTRPKDDDDGQAEDAQLDLLDRDVERSVECRRLEGRLVEHDADLDPRSRSGEGG